MTPNAAHSFSLVFRQEVDRAGLTQADIAAAVGTSQPLISQFYRGASVPSMEMASKLSDALMAPTILKAAMHVRSAKCPGCRQSFVRSGGSRRVYCSHACKTLVRKRGATPSQVPPERAAIRNMCRSCEPLGLCRDSSCPLRPFSPLPVGEDASATPAFHVDRRKLAWQGEDAEKRRAEAAERMRAEWADPEKRRQRSASNREVWARTTPEERERHAAAVRAGRRGNAA